MSGTFTMDTLEPGQQGVIQEIRLSGSFGKRVRDMGLVPGTPIQCLRRSPFGDPVAYGVRGTVLAMRKADCKNILLRAY